MPGRHRGGRKSKPKMAEEPRQVSTDWRKSPSAQSVAEKIARGGKNYLEDNFERVMIDSYELAEEPEFADLYFDHDQTGTVSARIGRKHEKQLDVAQKKGKSEYHQAIDRMRIEIIDELAKPLFRKEVFHRLERLTNRLAESSDARKLETALVLPIMLRSKEIPWGICGLILAIYDRTLERGRRELEEEEQVLAPVMEMLGPDLTMENVFSKMQDPGLAGQLTEKLEANPELRKRLEQQTDQIIYQLELSLWKGEIALDLFTPEELLLPYDRFQAELEAEKVDLAGLDAQKATEQLIQCTRASLVEIVTPERLQQIKTTLEQVMQQWIHANHKRAVPLQAEIGWLDDMKVEENTFLLAAYTGQIRRNIASQTSNASQSAGSTPSRSRGLVSRARRLFRKDKPGES